MKKILQLMVCLLMPIYVTIAQTGIIEGMVTTKDGNPAEFVNIWLVGTTKGTTVDSDGYFRLDNIKPGNYVLRASFVGLETQTKEVKIADGEILKTSFVLNETGQELKEVIVTAKPTKYVADYPSISLRLTHIAGYVSDDC